MRGSKGLLRVYCFMSCTLLVPALAASTTEYWWGACHSILHKAQAQKSLEHRWSVHIGNAPIGVSYIPRDARQTCLGHQRRQHTNTKVGYAPNFLLVPSLKI